MYPHTRSKQRPVSLTSVKFPDISRILRQLEPGVLTLNGLRSHLLCASSNHVRHHHTAGVRLWLQPPQSLLLELLLYLVDLLCQQVIVLLLATTHTHSTLLPLVVSVSCRSFPPTGDSTPPNNKAIIDIRLHPQSSAPAKPIWLYAFFVSAISGHSVKHNIIHKTGNKWCIATLPEEDWATAIGDTHSKLNEDWTFTDGQTNNRHSI